MCRGFVLFLFFLVSTYSGIADEIKICKCEGSIKSDFATLNIDADWDLEWPYKMDGTSSNALQGIHKQICYDAFLSSTLDFRDDATNEIPARADFAQVILFKIALEKVCEREDAFPARSFVFSADLKINFVTDGYIGYTLRGYENEGGNGCHSYIIARVISLTTGRCIRESDLILTNKLTKLRDYIVKKSAAEFKVEPDSLFNGSFFDGGTFMIEPDGIRWYIPPYTVYPGCAGVVDVIITWDELTPYFESRKYLNQFRKFHLAYKKITRTQKEE